MEKKELYIMSMLSQCLIEQINNLYWTKTCFFGQAYSPNEMGRFWTALLDRNTQGVKQSIWDLINHKFQ